MWDIGVGVPDRERFHAKVMQPTVNALIYPIYLILLPLSEALTRVLGLTAFLCQRSRILRWWYSKHPSCWWYSKYPSWALLPSSLVLIPSLTLGYTGHTFTTFAYDQVFYPSHLFHAIYQEIAQPLTFILFLTANLCH